ncbi:MAG: hypothetical protein CMF74_02980 [Maricaulis sp.]|nr:hypothetical protein [Maricaulis sp.]
MHRALRCNKVQRFCLSHNTQIFLYNIKDQKEDLLHMILKLVNILLVMVNQKLKQELQNLLEV